jgi:hypothetical protein
MHELFERAAVMVHELRRIKRAGLLLDKLHSKVDPIPLRLRSRHLIEVFRRLVKLAGLA